MFVKICGTTSEEDALLAIAMGADAVGFVFAPSPRQVSPSAVEHIASRLPRDVMTVGVFRNETAERIVKVTLEAGLQGAQLHGDEPPSVTNFVAERIAFTIKAFPAGSDAVARSKEHHAKVILVDSSSPGSGQVFDWELVEGVAPGRRLMLAGGLNPDNVALAIEMVRPWGVDVVSGVEASPGRKDPRKLKAFMDAVRETELRLGLAGADDFTGAAMGMREIGTKIDPDGERSAYDWESDPYASE